MLAQGLNPFILTQGYSFILVSFVLVGTVFNIVLDPLFIFTFGMGVSGSSLATVLSQMCFVLTHFLGFKGAYMSEGIADFVAGIVTTLVIFTTFPKVFKMREQEVKGM